MSEFIVHATLSNLLVSTFLAIIAWFVQTRFQAAALANLLWILVLIKMVTPPLLSVPVLEVQTLASTPVEPISTEGSSEPLEVDPLFLADDTMPLFLEATLSGADEHVSQSDRTASPINWLTWVGGIWIVTSGTLFLITIFRIFRFHGVLRANLRPPSEKLAQISATVAKQIGLIRVPDIVMAQANVSPFVWWIGGAPKIVVPDSAVDCLSEHDIRMVLAHEMAHVKRHDHWIRWLEWFTLLLLWWNPVMWWARRQLRVTEEIACDALVVEKTGAMHHDYAHSLLNMADILTTSAVRPPAIASAMNSGGLLEKRLKMLIANKTFKVPLWLRASIFTATLAVFPLGLVYAQDFDAVERRLKQAVKAGELSPQEAKAMLGTLDREAKDLQATSEAEDLKSRYKQIAQKVMLEVDRGDLTAEEAEVKLHKIHNKMFGKKKKQSDGWHDDKSDAEIQDLKRKYEEIAVDLMRQVDHGDLSGEEAELRLHEIRKKMFGSMKRKSSDNTADDAESTDLKRKYEAIAARLMQEVDGGNLSGAEAELKLMEIRKKMFDQAAARTEGRRENLAKAESRVLKDAYSDASEAYQQQLDLQAEKKKADSDARASKLDAEYQAYIGEIQREVDRGNISMAEAERQIQKIRDDLYGSKHRKKQKQRSTDDSDQELKLLKLHFAEIVQAIEDKVADGDMSSDEAWLRVSELKKKLYNEQNQSQVDLSRARDKIERQILSLRKQIQAKQDSLSEAENRYNELMIKLEKIEAADR